MYGKHVDTLNVYVRRNGPLGQPDWKLQGNRGNVWQKAQLTVDAKTKFNVSSNCRNMEPKSTAIVNWYTENSWIDFWAVTDLSTGLCFLPPGLIDSCISGF